MLRMNDGQIILASQEGVQLKTSRHAIEDYWLDSATTILSSDWIIRLVRVSEDEALITTGPGETYLLDSSTKETSYVDTDDLECKDPESTSAPSESQQHEGSEVLWSSVDGLWLMPDLYSPCLRFSNLPDEYRGWVSTYTRDSSGWWIGTREDGLWRFEIDQNQPTNVLNSYKLPVPGGRIRSLWSTGDAIWIGTSGAGLLKYDSESGTVVQFNRYNSDQTKLSGSIVSGFAQLTDTHFLVATRRGLDLIDSDSNRAIPISGPIDTESGETRPELTFLYVDDWGTIWIGHQAGITLTSIPAILASNIRLSEIGAEGPVSEIVKHPSTGRIWLGTNGNVISVDSSGQDVRFEMDVGAVTGFVANNTVTHIEFDENSTLVSTGSHGFVVRDGLGSWNSVSLHSTGNELDIPASANAIRDFEEFEGNVFTGTSGAGLIEVSSFSPLRIARSFDKPVATITAVSRTHDHRLLVGTQTRGAHWLHRDSLALRPALPWLDLKEMVDYGIVHDVASSSDNLHFAATSAGLIHWRADDSSWSYWSSEHGLPADLVNNVLPVDSTLVWFTTEKAVCRWDRAKETPSCLSVLESSSLESIQPRTLELSHEELIIGATNTVRMFPTGLFGADFVRPPLPLSTSLNSDQGDYVRELEHGGQTTLNSSTSVVTLNAELSKFDGAEEVLIRYQLLDSDPNPISIAGTVLEVVYHELPHRTEPYTFNLEVRDGSGLIHSTSYSFILPLPFWQTLWFIVATAMTVAGAIGWQFRAWFNRRRRESRELQMALASAREKERGELSRQIHDLSLQNLYVVKMQLDHLGKAENERMVASIYQSLDRSIVELRRLCGELLPPSLGPFGLESAVRSLVQGVASANSDLQIDLNIKVGEEPSTEHALAGIRALQTSVANVLRHAKANHLSIRVKSDNSLLSIEVKDDGAGFSVPTSLLTLARNRHYGLLGLHELARQFGGSFVVDSEPGRGTVLVFTISTSEQSQ